MADATATTTTDTDTDTVTVCNHCDRAIPSSNIDLHFVHCSRNLEKCKVCGDMIPRKYAEEHFQSTHALVNCSLCDEMMDRELMEVHNKEICPNRMLTCEYCELPLIALELFEHQAFCGNRTELCPMCNRYVRLRELHSHESRCNGNTDIQAESSRARRTVEREQGPPRRQQNVFQRNRLIFTFAVTGIAVLFGSFFFQGKSKEQ